MITALQIGLLLVLIALIGIILGYLFGKLSCKKQTDDAYFSKNDYCESEYVAASNTSADINNEQPSILSSSNVATAEENAKAETLLNEEPQAIVSTSTDESASSDTASESNGLENNSTDATDLSLDSSAEISNDSNIGNEEKQSFVSEGSSEDTTSSSNSDNTEDLASEDSSKSNEKESASSSSSNDNAPQVNVEDKENDDGNKDENENKPAVLSEPRDGKADNLCRIKGIGFVIEEKLHNLGVFHFDQIAAWSEKEIEWIDSHLAFSGRIKRESWIDQAEKLASGEETEFSKRVDKGSVSTSRKSTNKEKA